MNLTANLFTPASFRFAYGNIYINIIKKNGNPTHTFKCDQSIYFSSHYDIIRVKHKLLQVKIKREHHLYWYV